LTRSSSSSPRNSAGAVVEKFHSTKQNSRGLPAELARLMAVAGILQMWACLSFLLPG
jgi:hypothetical protein